MSPPLHRPQRGVCGCRVGWHHPGNRYITILNKTRRGCTVGWQDWAALGLDALSLAVPFLPAGGMVIRFAVHADDAGDVARLVDKVQPVVLKSLTARNFRENLRRLTDMRLDEIVGLEAHHILPQEFAQDFAKAGINIHDPIYGSWVDAMAHRGWSYAYNTKWKEFFKLT